MANADDEVVRLLSAQELSDFLQVPVKTIYRWRRQGDGPKAMRVGRYLRFDLDEVWAWLEERTA